MFCIGTYIHNTGGNININYVLRMKTRNHKCTKKYLVYNRTISFQCIVKSFNLRISIYTFIYFLNTRCDRGGIVFRVILRGKNFVEIGRYTRFINIITVMCIMHATAMNQSSICILFTPASTCSRKI